MGEIDDSQLTFDRMCSMYVFVLRGVAVLPFKGRDYTFIGTRLLTCYLLCSSALHWTMFTVYCFTSSSVQLEDVSLSILVIGLNYRFNTLMYKRKVFAMMIDECRVLWNFCNKEGRQTVLSYEHRIRQTYLIFLLSCVFVNVMYPIDALITRLPPLEPNGTERRILPYNWYADDTQHILGYWKTFILQMIIVQNAIIYAVACDAATPLLMMISAGYFRHLQDRLYTLHHNPSQMKQDLIATLDMIINTVKKLNRLCSKLADFAELMLLSQILSTAYNMSLLLIKLVSADSDKYKHITIMCVYVCQLYLIQWAPDNLYDESEGVALAAMSAYAEFLNMGSVSNYFKTMITRAQNPVIFFAGGIIPLNLESFSKIMKSAFSFFTILRNLDL